MLTILNEVERQNFDGVISFVIFQYHVALAQRITLLDQSFSKLKTMFHKFREFENRSTQHVHSNACIRRSIYKNRHLVFSEFHTLRAHYIHHLIY